MINKAFTTMLGKIRPQAIPLIELMGVSDGQIMSAIGNSYGDIYETQFEWARTSRLNAKPIPDGFKEHILPILHGKL